VGLDMAGDGIAVDAELGLYVRLVPAVPVASGLAVDVAAVEAVAMVLDMAGDGIAVDAELALDVLLAVEGLLALAVGLDVRLVPAVPLAAGLAVDVVAVETVATGLDVQGLDGGQLPAVEVVTVASSSPCARWASRRCLSRVKTGAGQDADLFAGDPGGP
jgi:hypothetical protein